MKTPEMWGHLTKEIRTLGPAWLAPQRADDGDVMKLQIKVEDGIITDARFKTYGCGSAIASSSLVTEWVKGRTLEEASELKNTEIAQELALPPVKIHCSILAEDAIKAAIEDYRKKHDLSN
jgi:nitrogen fixation NifU-like protein